MLQFEIGESGATRVLGMLALLDLKKMLKSSKWFGNENNKNFRAPNPTTLSPIIFLYRFVFIT
jgi:hypothetical protein